MSEDELLEFLAHPQPQQFEGLAQARLSSWTSSEAPFSSDDDGPTEPCSWRGFEPARATVLDPQTPPARDKRVLDAVAAAHWRELQRPPGTPLLLLLESEVLSHDQSVSSVASRLANAILQTSKDVLPLHPVARGRLDRLAIRSWLAGRQRARTPAWVVTSDSLLGKLLEDLDRRRLLFRLPTGSRVIRLCTRDELVDPAGALFEGVAERFGVPSRDQYALLVQPTLSSLLPVETAGATDYRLGECPPWMRCRIEEGGDDGSARLTVLDLATTHLPPVQVLEWPVVSRDGEIRLQSGG